MECGRADSVSLDSLEDVEDVEAGASFRRRLKVALIGLGYEGGADEFLRLHCEGHSLSLMVDFLESALDGGFPLDHVIAALRERSRGFL